MESGTLPFGLQVGAPRRTSNAMGAWERLAVAVLVATAACGLDKAGDVAESVDAWGAGVHAESGRVPALAVDASRDAKRAHDATVGAEAEGDAPHARDVSPERSVPPAETGADTGSDVTADSRQPTDVKVRKDGPRVDGVTPHHDAGHDAGRDADHDAGRTPPPVDCVYSFGCGLVRCGCDQLCDVRSARAPSSTERRT